jgi:carboxypeptidase C (cathepsin A)
MFKDPNFYLQQTYGCIWDLLVSQRVHWNEVDIKENLLPRLNSIPSNFHNGIINLQKGQPTQAFAKLFLNTVHVENQTSVSPLVQSLKASIDAIISSSQPPLSSQTASALTNAANAAGVHLTLFSQYVYNSQSQWSTNSSIGEANYLWFLQHVSFVNYSTKELRDIGRQQLARATTMLDMEKIKNDANHAPPLPPLAKSIQEQQNQTTFSSKFIRTFLEESNLLKFPSWFSVKDVYSVESIPSWLAPFDYSSLGEEDDFTSAKESASSLFNFVRYIPKPRKGLPFFLDSMARDARPVIVHEGIPGHWCQFRHSWKNSRESRRHWLDSVANEGLAYYFEEILMQAGLFDGTPRLRETMFEFMRLRALRVEVDVGLSTGSMSVEEATKYFQVQVPMSKEEAEGEVLARLAAPGQGLSYVIGKVQLFHYLMSAQLVDNSFDLATFHSNIEFNGNLPFVLQMHDAGLATTLKTDFINLHTNYVGVTSNYIPTFVHDATRIEHLPGRPINNLPAMFSGYADVSNGDRSLFYLMVHSSKYISQAEKQNIPIVIWLQGGNGCSSLIGAFTENGPFYSPESMANDLITNVNGLQRHAHVIYLDRPAGAGFSIAKGPMNDTWANDKQTAIDSMDAIVEIVKKYPWLCGSNVFVAGESYAGHFTIQLATLLVEREENLCVQLSGVMIGNGVVDINQTNYAWFEAGATHTIVEEKIWLDMKEQCDFTKDLGIDGNGCPQGVSDRCIDLVNKWMNQSGATSGALSLYDYYSNTCLNPTSTNLVGGSGGGGVDACADSHTKKYLNLRAVQQALHVRKEWVGPWEECSQVLNNAYSCPDTLVSMVPLYHSLLKQGRSVLVYSGDVDGIVPTLASKRWVDSMGSGKKTELEQWHAWTGSDGQLGGWKMKWNIGSDGKSGGNLTFATVRGAGHQVPMFQSQRADDLFGRFLNEDF